MIPKLKQLMCYFFVFIGAIQYAKSHSLKLTSNDTCSRRFKLFVGLYAGQNKMLITKHNYEEAGNNAGYDILIPVGMEFPIGKKLLLETGISAGVQQSRLKNRSIDLLEDYSVNINRQRLFSSFNYNIYGKNIPLFYLGLGFALNRLTFQMDKSLDYSNIQDHVAKKINDTKESFYKNTFYSGSVFFQMAHVKPLSSKVSLSINAQVECLIPPLDFENEISYKNNTPNRSYQVTYYHLNYRIGFQIRY